MPDDDLREIIQGHREMVGRWRALAQFAIAEQRAILALALKTKDPELLAAVVEFLRGADARLTAALAEPGCRERNRLH